MSSSARVLDAAFQTVGQKAGTEIWRIEDFQPVPVPKSEHGKFYSGDSYIVLQTTAGKGGSFLYDINFWIGKDTSQDEAGTAAIKTVELDATLGGRAVQHRELQGYESEKFLSYFKPCIIPLEGGVASGFTKPEEEEFQTRLYVCKGKRVVKMKQVPFARSSLNHDDIFILDTQDKIFQFNGANSNIQERAKALEVVQFLKDKYHEGTCDVAIVDDGKLDTDSDSGEFWVTFGGFAPIGRKAPGEDDVVLEKTAAIVYEISDGEVNPVEGELSKSMLENNKCFLLDCGAEVFVWFGRVTQVEERKVASQAAEEFVVNQNRPKSTRITWVIQGYETYSFKSKFSSWPAGSAPPVAEEGRGKVAAFLKQQGVGVKGMATSTPVNEEIPPLLEGDGKMEVWLINGSAKTPLLKEDIGKFHTGDCYIILYTYHGGDRREDYFLCYWIGKDSIEGDQNMAASLANKMSNSLKGRPVQGRIFQGKEPPQFIALFQPFVILKGGVSSSYKKLIEDEGLPDDTYTPESVALFEITGTSIYNSKAVQVDAVATSLNSMACFILQSGSSVFTWHGNQSTYQQQQFSTKVADFLKPGVATKLAKEGTESSSFWLPLGGKESYTSKKVTQDIVKDPHLFSFSFNKGKFEVEEVYNFDQDDLLTEDILILSTNAEVFVWVGQAVNPKEKQNAFEVGQKFIEMAAALEGLSPSLPLYKVTEGNEPCFFTTFFSWDQAKAMVQGNSFQKKLALLFGLSNRAEDKFNANQGGARQRAEALAALSSAFNASPGRSTNSKHDNLLGPNQGGPRQRAEALAALNSAFNSPSSGKPVIPRPSVSGQGSQRAAAVAALSSVLSVEKKSQSSEAPSDAFPTSFSGSSANNSEEAYIETLPSEVVDPAVTEGDEDATVSESNEEDLSKKNEGEETGDKSDQMTFSYERLKAHSDNPVTGINLKQREAYLSNEDFLSVFGMTKEAFNNMPRWKQDMQKKKFDLF